MNKKNREISVASEWFQYYTKKGKTVSNSSAHEVRGIDKDGFRKYWVTVNTIDGVYHFEQYSK